MGYSGFKQKFSPRARELALVAKRARIAPGHKVRRRGREALGDRVAHREDHSRGFFFAQENVHVLSVADDMSGLGSARSVR